MKNGVANRVMNYSVYKWILCWPFTKKRSKNYISWLGDNEIV